MLARSARAHPHRPAFGERAYDLTSKQWLGHYSWINYRQFLQQARDFARGLQVMCEWIEPKVKILENCYRKAPHTSTDFENSLDFEIIPFAFKASSLRITCGIFTIF
jgi:hypothetical protein